MILLYTLLIIVCLVLGLFVLIQNPKGGGLATGGSGSNMFGVQRTSDVLEKGTWVLIASVVVISLAITVISKTSTGLGSGDSKIQEQLDKTVAPSPVGGNATPAPGAVPAPATK
ncbi:MAG: preprotein translocase subunit SecG [Sphingobacteriaceae bacterium]|nr:preprotein translocase subunit SecG [Sphingobacteriaceae bacterium]